MKKIIILAFALFGSLALFIAVYADYSPSPGDIIKVDDKTKPALYLIDSQGNRQLYSNAVTFWTWHSGDWNNIKDVNGNKVTLKLISQSDFDNIPSTKNVVARANSTLLKFDNSGNIYTVADDGVINKVATSDDDSVAKKLYGDNYKNQIIVIQNSFQNDYIEGQPLTISSSVPQLTQPGQVLSYISCIDSDYGSDGSEAIYDFGKTVLKNSNGNDTAYEDSCSDIYTNKEWQCKHDGTIQAESFYIECSNGCENGHCVKSFDSSVCTDSDGGQNYTVQGVIRGLGWDNKPHANFDSCVDATVLREGFCIVPTGNVVGTLSSKDVTCPSGCKNGACVNPDTSCVTGQHKENDNCISDFQTCTIANGTAQKSWNGTTWGDCTLASCNSGYEKYNNECKNSSCVDSDGGQNYYVKGTATMGWQTTPDWCSTDSTGLNSGWIVEAWCDSNGIRQDWHFCPGGCSNGTCLQATSCSSGQHLENDRCEANIKSCNMLYGTGQQTWANGAWSDCQAVSCSTNYEIKNNICVAATKYCSQTDDDTDTGFVVGTGIQTWNGDSWGMCNATSCLPGFELNGNRCFASFHPNCVDYDSGKDYFTKSYTMFGSGFGYDYCDTSHNNDLGEWYCLNNMYNLQYYTCPKGCSNGACIQ
ncbi:MAG: hypothetical protein WC668_01645 [Patescibacteria group bacterium]|jgi:hypothetical protein